MDQVLLAITTLYSQNQNRDDILNADKYLQAFAKSKDSWSVIQPLLLSPPESPFYVQRLYYGSFVLQKNICFRFKEIEDPHSLLVFILNALKSYKSLKMIAAHLSTALTALCLQTNKWNDYFPIVLEYFPPNIPDNSSILLQIFTSIAESQIKLAFADPSYLYDLQKNINYHCPNHIKIYSLQCLDVWLRHVNFSIQLFTNIPIIENIFLAFKDEQYRSDASDCFFSYLKKLRHLSRFNEQGIEQLATNFAQNILQTLLTTTIQLLQTKNNDMESLCSISQFFTTYGYILPSYIPQLQSSHIQSYFEILVELSKIRNERIISDIASVYFHFLDYFVNDYSEQIKDSLLTILRTSFISFYEIIIRIQLVLPNEGDTIDFRDFRKNILADLLRELEPFVPQQQMVGIIAQIFSSTYQVDWRIAESALYAFRSLARHLSYENSEVLNQMLLGIIQIETTNVMFLSTSIFTVGRYCDWIHINNPSLAQHAISYIMKYTNNNELLQPTSLAFFNTADACYEELSPYFDDILKWFFNIYQKMPTDWANNYANYQDFIQGIVLLLKGLDKQKQKEVLKSLILPIIQQMETQQNPELLRNFISIFSSWIMFAVDLKATDIIVEIYNQNNVLIIISTLMKKFIEASNISLIQELSICMRYTFFILDEVVVNIVADINKLMFEWWHQTHLACIVETYLYLMRSLKRIHEVKPKSGVNTLIFKILIPFLEDAFQFLTSQEIDAHSDVTSEIFYILLDLLTYFPLEIEETILTQRIIPWCTHFIFTLNNDCFKFIIECLTFHLCANSCPSTNLYLQTNGDNFIAVIFQSIVKYYTRGRRDRVIEFMWNLYDLNPELITKKTLMVLKNDYIFLPETILESLSKSNLKKNDYITYLCDFFYVCRETL
ncbi:Nuclear transport receptor [Entamoeba marina]